MIASKLRKWFSLLKKTPLHPQWLIYNDATNQKRQLAAPPKRVAGRFKHLIIDETFFEPLPEDELQAWAGS
ncbi:MAG: hypothetical protein B7Y07_05115 [Halothiobacillus sp. 24-54-40]|jgi:hypothetical protein|nr:MAG: hypothetical protein B7Y58_09030 [Halothiobacillus sp. 35-54-62]OYZ87162.1 MAG: hypothetical protein B7Y07_05115 [Halothiobacillus sp. 24-54-40]OZA79505.1 MAG: hypothetical protein B7X64_09650 [Halothiobacillus sp. 39-53-45]HQS02382.1 hypothetical protein [Halothiobacillus sp.]HQS29766.1 hypothetical protein [Halothiobacillus sp.]